MAGLGVKQSSQREVDHGISRRDEDEPARVPEDAGEVAVQVREEGARIIREGLEKTGGPLRAARRDPRITRQAYYGMTLVYDPKKAMGLPKQGYLNALAAEGCPMSSTYWPVYSAPLLNLYDRTSPVPFRDQKKMQNYRDLKLPNTEKAVNETAVILSHTHMLGTGEYLGELLAAVRKVNENLPEAKKVRRKPEESAA